MGRAVGKGRGGAAFGTDQWTCYGRKLAPAVCEGAQRTGMAALRARSKPCTQGARRAQRECGTGHTKHARASHASRDPLHAPPLEPPLERALSQGTRTSWSSQTKRE